jgi:hypothetical protein
MRRHRPLAMLPLAVLLLAASCGRPASPPARPPDEARASPPARPPAGTPPGTGQGPGDARVARARAALEPFKRDLKQALLGALEKGGPIEAISACRDEAPRLAAAAAAEGVTVGRTSHRLRNPANAPADWMEPGLARYADRFETAPMITVELPGGSLGYLEPIGTQPLCLACHGQTLAPELEVKLAELYPEDEARGFAEGDFRGLFWAVVPPAER